MNFTLHAQRARPNKTEYVEQNLQHLAPAFKGILLQKWSADEWA
jgi:hypothetical protein